MARSETIGELAVKVGVDAEHFEADAEAKVHRKMESLGRRAGETYKSEFEDAAENPEPEINLRETGEAAAAGAAAGQAYEEAFEEAADDIDVDVDADSIANALDVAMDRAERALDRSDRDIDITPDPGDLEGDFLSSRQTALRRADLIRWRESLFDVSPRRAGSAAGEDFIDGFKRQIDEDFDVDRDLIGRVRAMGVRGPGTDLDVMDAPRRTHDVDFDIDHRSIRSLREMPEVLDDVSIAAGNASKRVDALVDDEDFRGLEALETEVNALRAAVAGFVRMGPAGGAAVGGIIGSILFGTLATATAGAAGIGGAILSGRLNEQLQELNGLMPDTAMNLSSVRAQIERLSQESGETPRMLTKQLYKAAEQGITDMDVALDALAAAADVKAVGAFDKLDKAFDSVVELMNNSQEPLEETDRLINSVFETSRRGTGSFEDYVGALGDVQDGLRGTEVSTEQALAAMVALEDRQTSTSEAAEILSTRLEESSSGVDDLGETAIRSESRLEEYRTVLGEITDDQRELGESAREARQNIEDVARQAAAGVAIEFREIGFAILPEVRETLKDINDEIGRSVQQGSALNDELTRIEDRIQNVGEPSGGLTGMFGGILPGIDADRIQSTNVMLQNAFGAISAGFDMIISRGQVAADVIRSVVEMDPSRMRRVISDERDRLGSFWDRFMTDPVEATFGQLPEQRLLRLPQLDIDVSDQNAALKTRNRLIHRARRLNDIYAEAAEENNRDLMRAIRRRLSLRQDQLEMIRATIRAEDDYGDALKEFGEDADQAMLAFNSQLTQAQLHYDGLIQRAKSQGKTEEEINDIRARKREAINTIVRTTEEHLEQIDAQQSKIDKVRTEYVRVRAFADEVEGISEATAANIGRMAENTVGAKDEMSGLADFARAVRDQLDRETEDILPPALPDGSRPGLPNIGDLDTEELARLEAVLRDPQKGAEELRETMDDLGIELRDIRESSRAAAAGLYRMALATLRADENMEEGEENAEDLRDKIRDLARAASGVLELARALGVVDEETARALQGMTQLAAATAQFASGNIAGGIASASSGLAALVGAFGGPSDAEKVMRENTEALRALKEDVDKLRSVMSATTGDVFEVRDDLQEFVDRIADGFERLPESSLPPNRPFGTTDEDSFPWQGEPEATKSEVEAFLDEVGISWTELKDLAQRMDVSIENLTKAMKNGEASADGVRKEIENLNEAMQEFRIEKIFAGVEGAMKKLQDRWALWDVEEPVQKLEAIRKAFLRLADLPASEAARVRGFDLSTPQGRQAFNDWIQKQWTALAEGTIDEGVLGDMTPGQFREWLKRMEGLIDEMGGAAGDGTTGFQTVNKISRVQANRIAGLLGTDVFWNRRTALAVEKMAGIQNGGTPRGGPPGPGGFQTPPTPTPQGPGTVDASQYFDVDVTVDGVDNPAEVERVAREGVSKGIDEALGGSERENRRKAGEPPTRTY